jgi:hypothetical protein
MFKALSNTSKYLIIGGVILVLALGIGLYLYFSGKAAGKRAGSINLSSSGGPDGNAPAASVSEVRQLAGKLYADMDGINFWGHNLDVWKDFLAMSDEDVIRVYNEFDTEYQKKTGQSLTQWVNSETGTGVDAWDQFKPTIIQRLNKLKLI